MKDRLQQIMDREGMTPGRFADSIGIQRSALSHILNGRNNPSLDVLMKVLNRFEYLATDWLMFGSGPMFKHQQNNEYDPDSEHEMYHERSATSLQPSGNASQTTASEDSSLKEIVIKDVAKERTVSRIMIFYSDNTFENFVPESSVEPSKN